MMKEFIGTVQNRKISPLEKDRLVWRKAKDVSFSVKLFFDFLEGGRTIHFMKRMIWKQCVPTKIGFFAWEAWWGKVLTVDQLKKRGYGRK